MPAYWVQLSSLFEPLKRGDARVRACEGDNTCTVHGDGDATKPAAWKLPPFRGTSPWRQEVQRRHMMLADDLARLDIPSGWDGDGERRYLVDRLLGLAFQASVSTVFIRKWWWGTEIERAWGILREVEERTVDLVPDEELPSRGAVALAHADCYRLSADDRSRSHLQLLLDSEPVKAAAKGGSIPKELAKDLRSAIIDVLNRPGLDGDLG